MANIDINVTLHKFIHTLKEYLLNNIFIIKYSK